MRTLDELTQSPRRPTGVPTSSERTRPRPRWQGWLRRATVGVLVLAAVGATLEQVATRFVSAPAPGELVRLPDGRRLHLQVSGREHDGPVVVLETGMGGSSAAWGWVQPAVAEHATVVAYDRAGLGWSDPSPHEPRPGNVVADLRSALAAAGLAGRGYLLVGHSIGGHHVRAFAQLHPDEVAAVVLVDPSHERQADVLGERYDRDARRGAVMLRTLHLASRLGITRLFDPFASAVTSLPEAHRSQAEATQARPTTLRTYLAEYEALDAAGTDVARGQRHLGERPLRVLMAGTAPDASMQDVVDGVNGLRRGLAALSNDGEAVLIPDADHVTLVTEREHARVVSGTVIDLLDAGR